MNKKVIRVFPRRTNATPDDEDVRIKMTPGLWEEADEVHISVAFTWDLQWAEWAEKQWRQVAPTKIGGAALNEPGGNFVPGMYMRKGYVITSRGCPNRCWFCSVPQREGGIIRELPVADGWIVQDDNLLSCSNEHIDKVFAMLRRQPHRPRFTGGLEAKLLTANMTERLLDLNPVSMFFAYDTPDDLEYLIQAGKYLADAGLVREKRVSYCYVLCGYPKDTIEKADKRMREAWEAGFVPCSMLYRNFKGEVQKEWRTFNREWANPTIRGAKLREI